MPLHILRIMTLSDDAVTFQYPTRARPTLHSMSVTVPPGAKVAIVGKNGHGKSTLCKILGGIYPLLSGQVWP